MCLYVSDIRDPGTRKISVWQKCRSFKVSRVHGVASCVAVRTFRVRGFIVHIRGLVSAVTYSRADGSHFLKAAFVWKPRWVCTNSSAGGLRRNPAVSRTPNFISPGSTPASAPSRSLIFKRQNVLITFYSGKQFWLFLK